MRIPGRFALLLALGCGACAAAAGPRPADTAAAEREVLMMIIAEHGRGAVLMDSTYGHACMERRTGRCDIEAPQAPWQAYLQAASRRFSLRGLLPADAAFTYEEDVGDQSALPCERRRHKLQLSRAGISPDGGWGVVMYYVSLPASAPMCTTGYGATVLVRKTEDGRWVIDRALMTTIS